MAGLNKNYDLVVNGNANSYVGKAQLSISLNDVVRTYGDTIFTDGTSYGIKNHDALVNGDEGTVSIKEGAITDGGLVDNNNKTNNKGDYKWTAGENGIVAENVANFAKNYDIQVTGRQFEGKCEEDLPEQHQRQYDLRQQGWPASRRQCKLAG